jgi:hypothetical protein
VLGLLLLATLLPLNETAAYLSAGVISLLLEVILVAKAPVIELDSKQLRVGRAKIDRAYLGAVESIDKERSFAERGHLLNAKAYTCFQSSVRSMVKVAITDKDDATPYWLFSSRNSEKLVELLR